MRAILIEDMEMPKSCSECNISSCKLYEHLDIYEQRIQRHPQCPLQDTDKLVILNKEQTTELLEIVGTLYACADDYYDEYAEHQYNKLYKAFGGSENE